MRALVKLLGFSAVVAMLMISCQKEFTIEDGPDPLDPTADSTYIDRFFYFEETAAGLDTMWGYQYKYDNLKRVTEVYYNEDFPANLYMLEYKYYYQNNDTIPYKMVEYDGPADLYPQEYYFTFDGQQRIIKDSIRHYNNSGDLDVLKVINYTYVPGKMYAHTRYTEDFPPSPPQEFIELDTATLNSSGDILSHKKYKEVGGVPELRLISNFTYGTQSGPFTRSSLFKAHHLLPMGETYIEELMTHKNLLTQHEEDENGDVSMDETFIGYQYNTNGMVKEFKTGNAAFPVVVRFFYKAL